MALDPMFRFPQQHGAAKEHDRNVRLNNALDKASKIAAERGREARANYIICSPEAASSINDLINRQDEV